MASGETTGSSNGEARAVQATAAGDNPLPNDAQRRVYEYVAERGPVRTDRVRRALFPGDRRALRQHLTMLKRQGVLAEDGDRVSVAVDLEYLASPKTVDPAGLDGPLRLRPANEADRAELVEVVESVAGEGTHVDAAEYAAALSARGALHRRDAERTRAVYVATADDALCGWAHVEASAKSRPRHTGRLAVGVVGDRRGAGVGTHLLEYATEWAASRDYEKLYQNVPRSNQSGIDFLTDRGWQVEATREDHYRLDGSYVDEVILSRAIGD
ncbi:GNAT family N-acetyltransferase [Halostella sp. JP-L12]|uniref:GNAT family N-acetyltransferase n=1 Tax=Halostella TaxID=1843185 RepID=UPI0013CEF5A6|nr:MULTISPECIES: GNAT family N-acetyltransferase [Halostella]NHN49100.1 GNAT family N-acetyltransferase [Halostella sp. JP-L12]